jgi:hypothetical protein
MPTIVTARPTANSTALYSSATAGDVSAVAHVLGLRFTTSDFVASWAVTTRKI